MGLVAGVKYAVFQVTNTIFYASTLFYFIRDLESSEQLRFGTITLISFNGHFSVGPTQNR